MSGRNSASQRSEADDQATSRSSRSRPPSNTRSPSQSPRRSRTAGLRLFEDRRAVQWTLEAFFAVLILFGALAIVAESNEQPTAGFERDQAREQLRQDVDDTLRIADNTGELLNATLYWDATDQRFVDAPSSPPSNVYYSRLTTASSHPLLPVIESTLLSQGLAYNVEFIYNREDDGTETQRVVYQGVPGEGAVSATATVTLKDGMSPAVTDSSGGSDCTLVQMGDSTSEGSGNCRDNAFYAPDSFPDSSSYNVIRVRVTTWRL